jgi:replication factor A1
MGAIEDVYEDLETDISLDEFREAVEEKVEQMAGLADEETAAMLIAHELSENEVTGIADITAGMEEVEFLGKVSAIGEMRSFERDDGTDGKVVNVDLVDTSGSIRAAFWDEKADAAATELEQGMVLRVNGRPKEDYNGVEINVNAVEPASDETIDVNIADSYAIEDLTLGLSDITVRGVVLDTDSVRTFDRDDGTEGKVANIVMGDETGRVRVTLWDDQAETVESISPDTTVEVIDGYVRERDGSIELHVGNRGTVQECEDSVEYSPEGTPIADVSLDDTVDLTGVVRSADPKRTFDRDDGSQGQVKNIRVQDSSGDIRVALWGEKANKDIQPGDKIHLADVQIQDGWEDDLEGSAGWQSTVTVLDRTPESAPVAEQTDPDEPDLEAFAAGDTTDEESIEFSGVVVQTGDPIVLDDGEQTVKIREDRAVELGEEITVRGTKTGEELRVDEFIN